MIKGYATKDFLLMADKHLPKAEAAILWTVFGIACLLPAFLSPALYVERKKTDEERREIILQCQFLGTKAYGVNLDVEGSREVCMILRIDMLTQGFIMGVDMAGYTSDLSAIYGV